MDLDQSQYRGSASAVKVVGACYAEVHLRPERVAYLIKDASWEDFDAAIAEASTTWGGRSCPIVPLKDGTVPSLWALMLERMKPDILVDFSGLDSVARQALKARFGGDVLDAAILNTQMTPGTYVTGVLPLSEPTFAARPNDERLERVALGVLGEEHVNSWRGSLGWYRPQMHAECFIAQAEQRSVLSRSLSELSLWFATNLLEGILMLVVLDDLDFETAVWTWNVRARLPIGSSNALYFIRPAALSDNRVRAYLEQLVSRKPVSKPDVLVWPDDNATAGVFEGWGWQRDIETGITTHIGGRERPPMDESPIRFRFVPPIETFVAVERQESFRIVEHLTATEPKTVLQARMPLSLRDVGGFCRLDVRGVPWWTWPDSEAVGSLIGPNAVCRDGAVSVRTSPATHINLEFNLPDPAKVMAALLGERGFTGRISDKGRIAQGVATHLGGSAGLATLANRQTNAIIECLWTPNRKRHIQRLKKELGDDFDGEKLRRVFDEVRFEQETWRDLQQIGSAVGLNSNDLEQAMTGLVRQGLIRRGLRHRCRHCDLESLVPLSLIDDPWRCTGCGYSDIAGSTPQPSFAFALNSLIGRAVDQGVMTHLLAINWLHKQFDVQWWEAGYNLTSESESGEADILALTHDRIITGEAKTSVAGFASAEIENRAIQAEKLGARNLVLAGLGLWSSEDEARAREQAAEKVDLILLGNGQLFEA